MIHQAVMVTEVQNNLITDLNGLYLDCTFGSGGHSNIILSCLGPKAKLVSFDKDPSVEASIPSNLSKDKRFKFICDSFNHLSKYIKTDQVTGILFDFGISTTQLDNPERGFSFRLDGPLDMRINQSEGITAKDWINTATEEEMSDVFWNLGEERNSRRIAKQIFLYRQTKAILNTRDLVEIILRTVKRRGKKHPATNIFRAIRMIVNSELEQIKTGLESASKALSVGGRLAVISFHSLEDRIVKRFIQGKDRSDLNINFSYVGKKFYKPERDEINNNPRSRSAILRIAEKLN